MGWLNFVRFAEIWPKSCVCFAFHVWYDCLEIERKDSLLARGFIDRRLESHIRYRVRDLHTTAS